MEENRKLEVLAAVSIYVDMTDYVHFSDLAGIKDERVFRKLMREYRRYRLNNFLKRPSRSMRKRLRKFNEAVIPAVVIEGLGDWDGSFLQGFLDWLIENGPEIIELILKIVALFGETVEEYDPATMTGVEYDVLMASVAL